VKKSGLQTMGILCFELDYDFLSNFFITERLKS